MAEKAPFSFQMSIPEREVLRTAANKERRSLTQYMMNAGLSRAKELYGIEPVEEKDTDRAA